MKSLAEHSDLFADLYRRAIDALSEQPLNHGGLVVAAHCIRDLVNGLPDVLDVDGETPVHVSLSKPAQDLAAEWVSSVNTSGDLDTPLRIEALPDGSLPVMTVPVSLMESARKVVLSATTASENARRRRSALVLGRSEAALDSTVRVFQDSVAIFEQARHPQRGREIDVDDVLARTTQALEVIENALEARLGSFFGTVEGLMDIINAANERGES